MYFKKAIPNSITTLNLLCGTLAIILAFKGLQLWSVYLILAAAVFDFFDGFAARLLKAYSPMGKELDSLADLVSFGLAPTILIYYRFQDYTSQFSTGNMESAWISVVTLIPVIITLASALRLAKFNVDTRQSENFIGVPTPANALLIVMFLHYTTFNPQFDYLYENFWFFPLLSVILSYLLICNIPMFSVKFKNMEWKGNEIRYLFLIFSVLILPVIIITNATWSLWLLLVFSLYIITNVFSYIFSSLKSK